MVYRLAMIVVRVRILVRACKECHFLLKFTANRAAVGGLAVAFDAGDGGRLIADEACV